MVQEQTLQPDKPSSPSTISPKRKKFSKKKRETFGPWIVSYADTVTLLLCFLVIFYAEQKKTTDLSPLLEIQEELSEKFDTKKNAERKVAGVNAAQEKLSSEELKKLDFVSKEKNNEVLIRLYEKDFFELGQFALKEDGARIIQKMANLLAPHQDKVFIQVEGHTDSLKVAKSAYYRSNLGLSSLRATEAAQIFLDSGFGEGRIRVLGFGSSRPLLKDRSPSSEGGKYLPENAKKNRRVELRLITESVDLEKVLKYKAP